MASAPRISLRIFRDHEALSRAAARFVAQAVLKSVRLKDSFSAALSGGATPQRLYELLGAEAPGLPWSRVHLFWSDERCVPARHRDSNYRLVKERLLSRIELPNKQVHRIVCSRDAEAAAAGYERTLQRFFGAGAIPSFDLVLLGIGTDGHAASLFPGDPALGVQDRWTAAVHPPQASQSRVTLTLPVLNAASTVLFLASGKEKAAIVQRVVEGERCRYPACMIRPLKGRVVWMIDQEAGRLLRRGSGR